MLLWRRLVPLRNPISDILGTVLMQPLCHLNVFGCTSAPQLVCTGLNS